MVATSICMCIYTYKHGGLYKLTHFVRTIIIVKDKTIGIHAVHTVAGTVDGLANENAAHRRKCTNLTISLHVAENTSLLAICIYICACVLHIFMHMCRSCILYCKKLAYTLVVAGD